MPRLSVFVAAVLLTYACDEANPAGPSASPATDQLIAALRQEGATVTRGDVLARDATPYLSTNAQVVVVNGGSVNVFEYSSEAAATADAGTVSRSDCSIGTAKITWIGPPHFYRKSSLIVIYAGSESAVLQPLGRVLGEPFARC